MWCDGGRVRLLQYSSYFIDSVIFLACLLDCDQNYFFTLRDSLMVMDESSYW